MPSCQTVKPLSHVKLIPSVLSFPCGALAFHAAHKARPASRRARQRAAPLSKAPTTLLGSLVETPGNPGSLSRELKSCTNLPRGYCFTGNWDMTKVPSKHFMDFVCHQTPIGFIPGIGRLARGNCDEAHKADGMPSALWRMECRVPSASCEPHTASRNLRRKQFCPLRRWLACTTPKSGYICSMLRVAFSVCVCAPQNLQLLTMIEFMQFPPLPC